MLKSKFSNDHVRAYTVGMNLWLPSFEIVEIVHSGNWKVKNPTAGNTWAGITACMTLGIHKWK